MKYPAAQNHTRKSAHILKLGKILYFNCLWQWQFDI